MIRMAAKSWLIHVRTIDGEQKTLQLQEDIYHIPVAELVEVACNKIGGLPNHKEFTFTLKRKVPLVRGSKTKLYTNDELGLLNPKKSLKQQGINKAVALTLNLRKRLFFTELINCSCHNEIDLTYLQLQNSIITGICGCTCKEAIELAALQCRIEYGNFSIDEDFLDNKLNSLLPRKYAKVQGIASIILRTYSSLERSESSNAKSEYIQLCTTLERYGITFFSGKEKLKKQLVNCYLGISHNFVWRIEAKTCEVLEKWHIASIKRWQPSPHNYLVTLIFHNDRGYSFWPSGESAHDTILQLLNDYKAITSLRYSGSVEVPMEQQSGRNLNSPDSTTISVEDLHTVGPASDPSPRANRSPLNSQRQTSAADNTVISLGESGANSMSEDSPITSEGEPLINAGSAEVGTLSVSIAGQDPAVDPVNDGETINSPATVAVRDTHFSSEGQSYERDTPISSEGGSPIHDIQVVGKGSPESGNRSLDHLTIAKLKSVRNRIWEARSKWQNIGIELDLKKNDLDAIKTTNGNDADACFREMLSLWLKQTKPLPTWSKMIRALKRPAVGFQRLAEDIEKKLTKRYIELLPFSQHVIDMIVPDEENREELEGRLREQTKNIIREFNILKHRLFDTLEDQKYSIRRLARYLKDYGAENLESIDDVQDFIEKNSSFFDYNILRYMIHLAGTERDEQCLKKYEKRFKDYVRGRIYECSSMIGASSRNPDSQSSKLCIKLDSEYTKVDPNKLKQFQCRLCNILNIPL